MKLFKPTRVASRKSSFGKTALMKAPKAPSMKTSMAKIKIPRLKKVSMTRIKV